MHSNVVGVSADSVSLQMKTTIQTFATFVCCKKKEKKSCCLSPFQCDIWIEEAKVSTIVEHDYSKYTDYSEEYNRKKAKLKQ